MRFVHIEKSKVGNIALVVLIFLLPVWIAFPALNAPFYFDDFQNLAANHWVTSFRPTLGYLVDYFEFEKLNRIVPIISFGLDYYAHGGVFAYMRLENLFYHSMTGIVLWAVMIQFNRLRAWGVSPQMLGVGALLWVVHPFMLDTPIYLVQRMAVLAALFSLASYWFWNRGWESTQAKWKWYLGAMVCFGLAIVSKENAILMLPLALLDLWLVRRFIAGTTLFGLIAGSFVLLALFGSWSADGNIFSHIINGYDDRYFTLEERLLTEARVLWIYLAVFLLPAPDSLAFYLEPVLSKGWFDPANTFWSVLAHVCVVSISTWGVWARRYWVAFGVLGYYLLHSLESSFIPLQIAFEHRMYLPGAFLVLVVWGPLSGAWMRLGLMRGSIQMAVGAAVIAVLGLIGQQRAFEWSYPVLFWEEQVHRTPQSSWAWNDYAAVLQKVERFDDARIAADRAVQLQPDNLFLLANRIMFCLKWDHGEGLEQWWEVFSRLLESPKIASGYSIALEKLSKDLIDAGEYDKAVSVLRVLEQRKLSPTTVLIEAKLYYHQKKAAEAEKILREGVNAFPQSADLIQALAVFLSQNGRQAEALETLKLGVQRVIFSSDRREIEKMYQLLMKETNHEIGNADEPQVVDSP